MEALPQALDLSKVPSMLPPPGVLSNFANPTPLAGPMIAISTTTAVLAVTLLSARLYSNIRITRSAGYDDLTCIAGVMFSFAFMGLVLNTRDYARHMWNVPITGFTASYLKIILAQTIAAALGFLFAKLSILLLFFRLFSPSRTFRYSVYVGIIWATLTSLTAVVVAGAMCAPRSGEAFDSLTLITRCSHDTIWAAVQGAFNAALDFYIFYLPIPVVWKLQLKTHRKIGVLSTFMTGLM